MGREYIVKRIEYKDTKDLILNVHYAKRMPSISYAYGLFCDDIMIGVCTYGSPASPWLCKGVCGEEHKSNVLELNRLVLVHNTFFRVCRYLEKNYRKDILEIETC